MLSLTAAVSIGATLAYLTDTDEDVNVMTLGNVKIDQLEYERVDDETANADADVQEFHDNKPLYPAVTDKDFTYEPGDTQVDWTQIGKDGYSSEIWDPEKINNELDKMVFVKNKGTYDAFVRTWFAFEANGYTMEQFQDLFHLNINEEDWTWQWQEVVSIPGEEGSTNYAIAVATYNKVLAPGALTEISLSQVALDSKADNEDIAGFGDTYQILVKTQAIQAQGFETATAALDEGFGIDHPFKTDAPTKGIELKKAIHYLPDGTQITDKITSVTFGLNKDHADVVNKYDGILADVGQDVPVYTYYVPNGANYDVYLLADDDIYAPESCYEFFYESKKSMAALKELDLSNLSTSRTTVMSRMFRNLPVTQIDVTGFDTSKVTAMDYIFYQCKKLTALDLSGWDVSNVTTMQCAFYQDGALKTIGDLEKWDLTNVVNMNHMFYQCSSLQELTGTQNWGLENVTGIKSLFHTCTSLTQLEGEENWDLGKVQDASYAFYSANKLTELSVADWDLGSCTNAFALFCYASSIEYLDVSDWDTSNMQDMGGIFSDCYKLANVDVSNWDTSSATNMYMLFCRCSSMTEVIADNWDLSNVTNVRLMFDGCGELVTVGASNWDTSSVTDMTGMFQSCPKLANLDVSKWDTGNVTTMEHMFHGAVSLEELDVSNWDVSKVQKFNAMFQGGGSNAFDMKLKELDVSNWNPASAVYMNHMFYGCSQLTELDMSNWNMPNLYTTSHMLADCSKLETIDVSGWQTTSSWYSMDAMFNDCRSVKTLDVSTWTTSGVVEFSQVFDSCYSLEEIKGLENWDTAKGKSFDETFLNCGSLKELNLSSWDTRSACYGNKHLNNDISNGFRSTFSGVNSLEKLILGENFDFDGNGTVSHKATLPNSGKIDGQTTLWYNEANDTYYAANEIPDGTAATYIAAVKP